MAQNIGRSLSIVQNLGAGSLSRRTIVTPSTSFPKGGDTGAISASGNGNSGGQLGAPVKQGVGKFLTPASQKGVDKKTCYTCGDSWYLGHTCKGKQLYSMVMEHEGEEVWQVEDSDETAMNICEIPTASAEPVSLQDSDSPLQISMHALIGCPTTSTFTEVIQPATSCFSARPSPRAIHWF